MSMSVNFHLNNVDEVKIEGYATSISVTSEPYAVLKIDACSGYDKQEVALFLDASNISALINELRNARKLLEEQILDRQLILNGGISI